MMAKKDTFKGVCGLNEAGVDQFLADAEALDKGTTRFPWPKPLKGKIKAAIDGMMFMPAVKDKINAMVMKEAGPGLLNRGPFDTRA